MNDLDALTEAMRDALLDACTMYGLDFRTELNNVAEECVDVALAWGDDTCWICDGQGVSGLCRDGNPNICKRCEGSGKFTVPDGPSERQIEAMYDAPSQAEQMQTQFTIQDRLK